MESKHRTVQAIRTVLTDSEAWALVIVADHATRGIDSNPLLLERAQEAADSLRDQLVEVGLTKLEVQRRERWFQ